MAGLALAIHQAPGLGISCRNSRSSGWRSGLGRRLRDDFGRGAVAVGTLEGYGFWLFAGGRDRNRRRSNRLAWSGKEDGASDQNRRDDDRHENLPHVQPLTENEAFRAHCGTEDGGPSLRYRK